jgi:hypothetical protein
MKLVVAPFDAPGCLGRGGSRRIDPATAIGCRYRRRPFREAGRKDRWACAIGAVAMPELEN